MTANRGWDNLRPAPRFEPGNAAAIKSGAYARLRLAPEAAETAQLLRERVPAYPPSDEPAIQAFVFVLEPNEPLRGPYDVTTAFLGLGFSRFRLYSQSGESTARGLDNLASSALPIPSS